MSWKIIFFKLLPYLPDVNELLWWLPTWAARVADVENRKRTSHLYDRVSTELQVLIVLIVITEALTQAVVGQEGHEYPVQGVSNGGQA